MKLQHDLHPPGGIIRFAPAFWRSVETMVLVFGFSFPSSASVQGKVVSVSGHWAAAKGAA